MSNYKKYSDFELTVKLREGDMHAYTEIYNRFKKPLFAFLWKRLPNKEEVLDIIQDVFLNLWLKRAEISFKSSLSAYMFTSVRNRLLDRIAHENVKQKYIDSFKDFITAFDASTDFLVRSNEMSKKIKEELLKLPPRTREVFELSRLSHLTRKEIALKLNISEETVKNHIHKALRILRLTLKSFLIFIFLNFL